MATPSTSSKFPTLNELPGGTCSPPRPNPDRVRRRLEAILAEMRAEPKMAWDFSLQLLYQKIFPDMTHFLPEEEGERYRADFEKEWERLAAV
jgi:hypothetical protein